MALDHELTPTHRTIFSVSKDYFAAAAAELCDAFPAARIERVGLEAGRLTVERAGISEVAEACGRRPIVFVRHLMRELLVVPFNSAGDHGSAIADQLSELRPPDSSNCQVALQVWSVGSAPAGFRADELWCRVASALRHRGFDVARAGREPVLSVCLSPSSLHLGINNRSDALVDWPGGRVGLSRSADQLSRSEFKLEELFKVFDVTLPEGGVALDLGASPGGWTRLLRERGMTVWAVDPATLDPRIEDDNRVHHARTTAGAFLAHTEQTFDLIVNDMRMEPARSCQIMLDAAVRLRPRGSGIMTLKLSRQDPLRAARESLRTLAREYEIVNVRQLFHNRNEVSIVVRRKPEKGDP